MAVKEASIALDFRSEATRPLARGLLYGIRSINLKLKSRFRTVCISHIGLSCFWEVLVTKIRMTSAVSSGGAHMIDGLIPQTGGHTESLASPRSDFRFISVRSFTPPDVLRPQPPTSYEAQWLLLPHVLTFLTTRYGQISYEEGQLLTIDANRIRSASTPATGEPSKRKRNTLISPK